MTHCPHLSWHMHEQHCSHWSLSLTVPLIRSVDGVGLQDPVQILLPAREKINTKIIQRSVHAQLILTPEGNNLSLG